MNKGSLSVIREMQKGSFAQVLEEFLRCKTACSKAK
jgi:hypothetical protein